MTSQVSALEKICALVREFSPDLAFNIMEIGARNMAGEVEPFYQLLELFPKSRVVAFEADADHCVELNSSAPDNIHYYPVALAEEDGVRTFYETVGPECSSLYKPNEALLDKYNGLGATKLKSQSEMNVRSLDSYAAENELGAIDFVKIDIQGAEVDVFKGAIKALEDTVFIVSEVEFVPLYIDQPLFGDVCEQLLKNDLMFHKFMGVGGRSLKPVIVQNNVNHPTQHMWTDAIYIKHVEKLESLSGDSLLKLALLGFLYESPDLTFHCFQLFDKKSNTDLHMKLAALSQGA